MDASKRGRVNLKMTSGDVGSPVPVVRIVVTDDRGRVLLLRRRSDTDVESWCLPGGKIETGETLEDAIRRELKEETDLDMNSLHFLFSQATPQATFRSPHYLNLYFECRCAGTVTLNSESSDFVWISEAKVIPHSIVFGNGDALQRYWALRHGEKPRYF